MDNEKELQELKRKLENYKMICEDLILENKSLKEKIEELIGRFLMKNIKIKNILEG